MAPLESESPSRWVQATPRAAKLSRKARRPSHASCPHGSRNRTGICDAEKSEIEEVAAQVDLNLVGPTCAKTPR